MKNLHEHYKIAKDGLIDFCPKCYICTTGCGVNKTRFNVLATHTRLHAPNEHPPTHPVLSVYNKRPVPHHAIFTCRTTQVHLTSATPFDRRKNGFFPIKRLYSLWTSISYSGGDYAATF